MHCRRRQLADVVAVARGTDRLLTPHSKFKKSQRLVCAVTKWRLASLLAAAKGLQLVFFCQAPRGGIHGGLGLLQFSVIRDFNLIQFSF